MHEYYVYILTNKYNSVLYIGVTNNLVSRVGQHKFKTNKGFTAKYNISKLIYFEFYTDIRTAISREKQIKKFRRSKKDALIYSKNKDWHDLTEDWE